MKLLNSTKQHQQILLINGASIDVSPGETAEVDQSLLYKDELDRISFVFSVVEEAKVERTRPPVQRRSQSEKTEITDGGAE